MAVRIPFIRDLRNQVPKKKNPYFQQPVSISQKIYNSTLWKKLRNAYIAEFPLCEECMKHGRVTPADAVHHRVPFLSGNTQQEIESLAYDYNNLMSVCSQCHVELHKELGGYGHYSKKEKDK